MALGVAAWGCGDGSDSGSGGTTGGGGGSAGAGGSSGSGGAGGSGGAAGSAPCSEDPSTIPPGASCILSAKGSVVDGAGAPISAMSMSVCGTICWYGETTASGAFDVPIGAHIVPDKFSALTHGRPSRTSFYFTLPAPAASQIDLGELLALDLPASGPTLVVKTDKQGAPAQKVTSGDVTLDVPAGTQVKLDVEDVAQGAAGKEFKPLTIPANVRDRFAPASLNLIALYAMTPFEAQLVLETTGEKSAAQLSVKNTAALPAGTMVEFLALGSYLFPEWVEPARFEVVATGKVSVDGTSIDMDAGQGVSYLTWVGVRKKP